MGLIRLLIFALVIWLVWRLYQSQKHKIARSGRQSRLDNEKMVKCEVCGTHLPENSAVDHDNRWFCSRKHMEQYRSDNNEPW